MHIATPIDKMIIAIPPYFANTKAAVLHISLSQDIYTYMSYLHEQSLVKPPIAEIGFTLSFVKK